MKPHLHSCRADGCQVQIPRGLLMCADHWRMVPAALRREVTRTHRELRYSAFDIGPDYLAAVAAAVAAVRAKQERKAKAAAGPSGSLFNE